MNKVERITPADRVRVADLPPGSLFTSQSGDHVYMAGPLVIGDTSRRQAVRLTTGVFSTWDCSELILRVNEPLLITPERGDPVS
jgi:hypothetical protein